MTDIVVKNVLEHVGGIYFVNPNIVLNNINILKEYGVSLNEVNDASYTVFGISDLDKRLENIRNSQEISGLNLSQIRDLMIRNNEYSCKNNIVCDTIVNVSLKEEKKEGIKRMI